MNLNAETEWQQIQKQMMETLRTGKQGAPKFSAELVEDNQRVIVRNHRGAVVKSLSYTEWKAIK